MVRLSCTRTEPRPMPDSLARWPMNWFVGVFDSLECVGPVTAPQPDCPVVVLPMSPST